MSDDAYRQVIKISQTYLGSSTKLIDRQIKRRLNKAPCELCYSDLAGLIDWLDFVMSSLCDDQLLKQSYLSELRNILKTNPKVSYQHAD